MYLVNLVSHYVILIRMVAWRKTKQKNKPILIFLCQRKRKGSPNQYFQVNYFLPYDKQSLEFYHYGYFISFTSLKFNSNQTISDTNIFGQSEVKNISNPYTFKHVSQGLASAERAVIFTNKDRNHMDYVESFLANDELNPLEMGHESPGKKTGNEFTEKSTKGRCFRRHYTLF